MMVKKMAEQKETIMGESMTKDGLRVLVTLAREAKARAEATPDAWLIDGARSGFRMGEWSITGGLGEDRRVLLTFNTNFDPKALGAFVSASRSDVPALADGVLAMAAALGELAPPEPPVEPTGEVLYGRDLWGYTAHASAPRACSWGNLYPSVREAYRVQGEAVVRAYQGEVGYATGLRVNADGRLVQSFDEIETPCSTEMSRVFALEVIERQARGDCSTLALHGALLRWHEARTEGETCIDIEGAETEPAPGRRFIVPMSSERWAKIRQETEGFSRNSLGVVMKDADMQLLEAGPELLDEVERLRDERGTLLDLLEDGRTSHVSMKRGYETALGLLAEQNLELGRLRTELASARAKNLPHAQVPT